MSKEETQTCPRRTGEFGPWDRSEGQDTWRLDRGYRFCSFCGSLHPDEFMEALVLGRELIPTDKSYKAYIVLQETEPDAPKIISATDHPEKSSFGMGEWTKVTPDLKELMLGQGWRSETYTHVLIKPYGEERQTKFYFVHLSEEDKRTLINLLNDQKIKFGYPGFFYTRPYFIKYG